MAAPHLPHHVDVPAGLDLHLDALIAQLQVLVHAREERVQARLDAETHPHGDPLPRSSEHARQRLAPQPRDQVHVGELDAGPGHGVAAEGREAGRHVGQAADPSVEERGREKVADRVASRLDGLVAEERTLPGDHLTPARRSLGLEPDQEQQPRLHPAEAGLEGLPQREPDQPQLERVEADRSRRCDPCNTRCSRRAHSQLYTTREPSGFGNDAGGRIVRRNEC